MGSTNLSSQSKTLSRVLPAAVAFVPTRPGPVGIRSRPDRGAWAFLLAFSLQRISCALFHTRSQTLLRSILNAEYASGILVWFLGAEEIRIAPLSVPPLAPQPLQNQHFRTLSYQRKSTRLKILSFHILAHSFALIRTQRNTTPAKSIFCALFAKNTGVGVALLPLPKIFFLEKISLPKLLQLVSFQGNSRPSPDLPAVCSGKTTSGIAMRIGAPSPPRLGISRWKLATHAQRRRPPTGSEDYSDSCRVWMCCSSA